MIYLVTNQTVLFELEYQISTVSDSLSYLSTLDEISYDSETEGFDPYTKNLLLVQLGDYNRQYVIDCSTVDIRLYKDILESKLLIMHNAKFDLRFLYHKRIIPTKIFDTFLAERVLSLGLDFHRKALDAVVERYCKKTLDKTVRGEIHRGLTKRVIQYSADDIKYLGDVKRKQIELLKEQQLTKAMSLDNKFVLVLAYIEYCGIYLNKEEWELKCIRDDQNAKEREQKLNDFLLSDPEKYSKYISNQLSLFSDEITFTINWNSSSQVIPILKSLGVNTLAKDKETGEWKDSADKKVLEPQKHIHPFVSDYIKYSEAMKIVGTYGRNWYDYIIPETGRIHTNFSQLMNTGRLSCGQKANKKKGIKQLPNLQNIPSDYETRHCFQGQGDNTLIVSDFSGQEQIVLANKSMDEDLLYFYDSGQSDMHSFIASKIFPELNSLSADEIKSKHKDKRQIAKSAGFAINYGGTGITIAQNVNIPLEEGNAVYEAYFKAFPGLDKYFKQEKKRALALGYILFNNISNRKCYIPNFSNFLEQQKEFTKEFWEDYRVEKAIDSEKFQYVYKPKVRKYFKQKGDIERMSLNFPIQGSSAEITKLAGIYFFEYLLENDLLFIVLLPNVVHDEYVAESSLELAPLVKEKLKECMERAGDYFCKRIKLKADPMITKSWEH